MTFKLLLFLLLLTNTLLGQSFIHLAFPDPLKKATAYFSPYIKFDVSPSVIGVLNFNAPYDSLKYSASMQFFWQTQYATADADSLNKIYGTQTALQIVVDTTQEIKQQLMFYKTFKYDSLYESPRYIKLLDKKGHIKVIKCKHDTALSFAGMPVYIVNNAKDTLHILNRDLTVNLTQEILDKNGNWREIEEYHSGACGMSRGWKALFPNQILVTSIIKYKGNYKTLARLKLDNGSVIYSSPYSISVNEDILSDKIKIVVMDGSLFELK